MVFFSITQLATHVFYDELHLKTSLMKKSIYILTLILLNLLTFSSTVNAQILEEDDTITLDIHPNYLATSGRFNIKTDNPLKEYFVNIDGVIRIGDNSIKLKKKYQPHARIRIEVNKGRLNLSGISKVTKSKSSQGIVEGRLETPVDINFWTVRQMIITCTYVPIPISTRLASVGSILLKLIVQIYSVQ